MGEMPVPMANVTEPTTASRTAPQPTPEETDLARQLLEAAMAELRDYRQLTDLVLAPNELPETASTRFSWAHPLGLVIKS